jgi:hypothetical protein
MANGPLCKYRDALGQPRKGFHSIRLFNVAILDVIGTFAAAWVITRLTAEKVEWRRYTVILVALLALGEFLHILFCVPTNFQKFFSISK